MSIVTVKQVADALAAMQTSYSEADVRVVQVRGELRTYLTQSGLLARVLGATGKVTLAHDALDRTELPTAFIRPSLANAATKISLALTLDTAAPSGSSVEKAVVELTRAKIHTAVVEASLPVYVNAVDTACAELNDALAAKHDSRLAEAHRALTEALTSCRTLPADSTQTTAHLSDLITRLAETLGRSHPG